MPFYLLHQPVIVAIAFYVVQWQTGVTVKWLVLVSASSVVTLGIYELLVRRVALLRAIFGIKAAARPQQLSPKEVPSESRPGPLSRAYILELCKRRQAMKGKISFTVVVLVFSIVACDVTIDGGPSETVRGSGTVVEENRSLGDLSGVQLTMPGTLHIAMGTAESLRIEAEDNLLPYIQTAVRAGDLVIETRQGINLRGTRPIHYYLTVDELTKIVISSSGDVVTQDLQSQSFSLTSSSSGDLSIGSLECTSLRVTMSSSGNVEILGGQVQRQDITLSSSGEYRAQDLASVEAEVTLTSSGTATVRVSDRLGGRLSSSGNVYYIGNPEVSVRTTSSGRAVQRND